MEAERAPWQLAEAAELAALARSAAEASRSTRSLELAEQQLAALVRRYCEAPALLEPSAALLLPELARAALTPSPLSERRTALLFAYLIMRARGYKRAVLHLPHEISDLQPVLVFLESEDPKDRDSWATRFVLLLWLSIIIMMPFHMSRLDSFSNTEGENRKTVMQRIFDICKTYSLVTDACSEAGAYLTSKFLTRSDVLKVHLGEFFDWSCKQNVDLQEEDTINYGVLASVAAVLKHGKREDLMGYTDELLHWIITKKYQNSKAILVRKYGIKIIQRIGLILLKPRLAPWRYIQETSSLTQNLQSAGNNKMKIDDSNGKSSNFDDTAANDDQDIPEQIEEIIEHLLMGLRDGDNVVRWSAAKGIGRVAARLNCSAAGDIVLGIMDLFSPHEGDGAWHGGCLALAELGRRGLLLKSHLQDVVRVVILALQYEEVRGHTPTGRHVRDAACYVCWAFVRAYTTDLTPYIHEIVIGLIINAVYDREINCRHAARAAFEESIGRIQLINLENLHLLTAEQFYLSSRKKAYLCAAPYLAKQNNKYTKPLINHLMEKKIQHWDINIRELASQSLHLLTKENPIYMAENVLPKLIEKTLSSDLNTRHGCILAIGEIIYGLYLNGITVLSSDIFDGAKNIVPTINSKYQFRGLGGELMRQACCVCIENLALAKVKYHRDPIIDDWLTLIEDCLSHEVTAIRLKAISALSAVFDEFLRDDISKDGIGYSTEENDVIMHSPSEGNMKVKRMELIIKYCSQLKNVSATGLQIRMGYSLAIGGLPCFALEENLNIVVMSFIECAQISDSTLKWAESRRDALKGLTHVCKTLGIDKIKNLQDENSTIMLIFNCFLRSLNEYTIEMRGDIGAWVREASMAGLLSLCIQCAEEDISIFTQELVTNILIGITQQSVEKIDRTRALAGKVFMSLIYCKPTIPFIPHHEELCKLFPNNFDNNDSQENLETTISNVKSDGDEDSQNNKSTILWLFAEHTMPLFVRMLDWEIYRYNILIGITVSAGDMTESLVKHSTHALFAYLTSLFDDSEKMLAICNTITQIFADNHEVDRIMIPMLKFLDRLLSSGCVSHVLLNPSYSFSNDLLNHVKLELKKCKNIYKLLDGISVLCQLIQVSGDVCQKSLNKLVICICHVDKYVRKATATKLYDALLLYGDAIILPDDNMDQAMTLLADTNWELNVSDLRPIRNELCALMNIPQPIPIQKK